MRVRVLGPLEVRKDEEWHRISAAKQRALLATLVVAAGQPVTVETLVEALWPDGPVASAVNQVHGYVWRLRAALGDPDGRLLRTRASGYELAVAADLDVTRFEQGADEGMRALRDDAPERAAALLGDALSLWRGPAYGDVPPTAGVRSEADRLDERRLATLEARIDADLLRGLHRDVVAEVRGLVDAEPFRERFSAQLMLALYRSGRQGEALAAYRQLHRCLDDQLGVTPNRAIRELHQQILGSSPDLDVPRPPAVAVRETTPRQLPADVADFTGRANDLDRLDAIVGDAMRSEALPVVAIGGAPGVGKTGLAVHWAHRLTGRYPDGQLYADLRGRAARGSRDPLRVLHGFLRGWGYAPERVPRDLDETAGVFRSLLADRRVLVVLDDAASADQVRPLLPGSPTCAVVVTSRNELGDLVASDGARRVVLGHLRPDESLALLTRILGSARVNAERPAAMELAGLCDHLPRALRTVAAALDADRQVGLAAQVRLLREGGSTARLVDGDAATGLAATVAGWLSA